MSTEVETSLDLYEKQTARDLIRLLRSAFGPSRPSRGVSQAASFSTKLALRGVEKGSERPIRSTDIRRGIDSLAPARFDLTDCPPVYVARLRRLRSRCSATLSRKATRITNKDIHRDIRVAVRTGPVRFQFPGTRRFCLHNS